MVQPTQPNQPKPNAKLTKLLECFFKALQKFKVECNKPKLDVFAQANARTEIEKARQAVNAYKGDNNYNRLYERMIKLHEIAGSHPRTSIKDCAFSAAADDWFEFIKSPWAGKPGNIADGFTSNIGIPRKPAAPITSKPNMANEKQTPADTGTKSTEAGAVQAAGKPTKHKCQRGKDVTFKVNSKLTTNLITLGHAAFQALEKPDKDVDLELCKRLWIRSVKALIGLRLAGGGAIPAIKGVDVAAFYGINGATPSKTEAEIKRLEAKLAKLKAKAGKK